MEEIMKFLTKDQYPKGDGDGDGSGSGDGDGSGCGCGYGSGYGSGDGSGYGYGYGYGYGSGDGDGSGDGSGYGSGYGSGDGSGDGDGDGYGIENVNGQKVYVIDEISTFIDNIHGNYAKGRILHNDLTESECFIAKCGNYFAHGETLSKARSDAQEKYEVNSPLDERIKSFNEKYPSDTELISGQELFSWHHILTGSCLFGRQAFCKDNDLDVNDKYTIPEFIKLTKKSFRGDIIEMVEESRCK